MDPRSPATVEKRTKTGVRLPFSDRNEARVYFASDCVALEHAVRGGAAGVDDPLGDALVVEVGDLLPEDEVLQQGGTPQAGLERVLVVGDRLPEVRREPAAAGVDAHAVEGRVPGIEAGLRGARRSSETRVCSVSVLAVTEASAGSAVAPGFGVRAPSPISSALFRLNGKAAARACVFRILARGAVAVRVTGAPARAAHGRLGGAFPRGRGLSGLGHR